MPGRLPAGRPADRRDPASSSTAAPGRSATRPIPGSSPPRSRTGCRPGIVVVSVNYRLLPLAGVLQQAGDVARAIAFVQKRAAGWQADPARLVVVGHSTGAHLAALLAADPGAGARPKGRRRGWRPSCSTARRSTWWRSCARRIGPCTTGLSALAEAGWQAAVAVAPAAGAAGTALARPLEPAARMRPARRNGSPPPWWRVEGRAEVHEVALSHVEINARLGLSNRVHRAGRCLPEVGGRAVTIRRWPALVLARPRRRRRGRRCRCAVTARDLSGPSGAEPDGRSPDRRRRPSSRVATAGRKVRPAGGRARRARSRLRSAQPAQKLDVYIPEGAKSAPILLMVHGGAWMLGDKGNSGVVANKVRHWLPRGYIVVSPNYRMSRPPSPLDQTEDVGRALAFVQANAASGAATGRGSCSWGILPAPTSWPC